MIVFQVFYRRTDEEAKAINAQLNLPSPAVETPDQINAKMPDVKIEWPDWITEHFKKVGMFLDDNNVWTIKVSYNDALKLHDWFYKELRPWAVGLGGERREFATRLLAHAVDDAGEFEKMGLESF